MSAQHEVSAHAPSLSRLSLCADVHLITTAVIGIIMAYRFSQRPIVATICLLMGIALPGLLLWIYH
jgi:hypothetical protein